MRCVTHAIIFDINPHCDCCIMVCSYLWLYLHWNRSAHLLSRLCLDSSSYLYLYVCSYLQPWPQPSVTKVVPRVPRAPCCLCHAPRVRARVLWLPLVPWPSWLWTWLSQNHRLRDSASPDSLDWQQPTDPSILIPT